MNKPINGGEVVVSLFRVDAWHSPLTLPVGSIGAGPRAYTTTEFGRKRGEGPPTPDLPAPTQLREATGGERLENYEFTAIG